MANALMTEKNGSAVIKLYGDRDQQEEWGKQDKQNEGADNVKHPFSQPAYWPHGSPLGVVRENRGIGQVDIMLHHEALRKHIVKKLVTKTSKKSIEKRKW
nr:hypothetical protein [Rhizobium sullae]